MALVVTIIIFCIFVLIGFKDPKKLLYITIFFAPWNGVEFEAGLSVTVFKLGLVCLGITVLLSSRSTGRNNLSIISKNEYLWLFVVYSLIWSVVQIIFLPYGVVQGDEGFRSGYMRPFSQMIMFSLYLVPAFILPKILHTKNDILQCGKIYLISISILAAIGFIQLILWYSTGNNPLPIGYVSTILSGDGMQNLRSGIDVVKGVSVYRMNSFGGEPKGLATGIVVGLLILQVILAAFSFSKKMRMKIIALWVFLFTALLLTWSTSGIFLIIIAWLSIIVLNGYLKADRITSNKNTNLSVMLLVAVILGSYLVINISGTENSITAELIEKRFIDREPVEDFDEIVLTYLEHNLEQALLGVGLGNVHLHAVSYIPPMFFLQPGDIFVAKSGYLRIISELGVVGLLLLVFAVRWWMVSLRWMSEYSINRRLEEKSFINTVLYLTAILFICGMARGYVWPQMFIMFGICAAYINILQRDRAIHRSHQDIAARDVIFKKNLR